MLSLLKSRATAEEQGDREIINSWGWSERNHELAGGRNGKALYHRRGRSSCGWHTMEATNADKHENVLNLEIKARDTIRAIAETI